MLEVPPFSNTSGVTFSSQATGNLVPDSVENICGHYSRALLAWGEKFLATFHDRSAPALVMDHLGMSEADFKVVGGKWEVDTLRPPPSLSPRKSF